MKHSSHPPSHRPSNPAFPIPHFDGESRKEAERKDTLNFASADRSGTKREVMPSEKDQPISALHPDPLERPKYGEKNQNGEFEGGFPRTPATMKELDDEIVRKREARRLAEFNEVPPALAQPRGGIFVEGSPKPPSIAHESFESELASKRFAARSVGRSILPSEKTQPMAARAPRASEEGGHFGETNHNGFFGIGHPLA